MAFCLFSSFPMCSFPIHSKLKSFSYNGSSFRRLAVFSASRSADTNKTSIEDDSKIRRSANYHLPIWDYDYVQSLRDGFVQDESYNERASNLQEEVRMMLGNMVDSLEKLELIDTLQRLGLSHHFEAEINKTLKNISTDRIGTAAWKKDNLYATALEFKLLRQHGYKVDQDVFTCFMDDVGNIKSSLNQDFKGLLNLYEASYLLLEGETMLENARELAAKLLKQYLKENNDDQYLRMLVDHAFELPLHWRLPRLEARWFIDVYEKNKDKNPIILELAILDYNIVQSMHLEDFRYASTWWKELGLGEKLGFARDRIMSNFLWSVGMVITPQDTKSRRIQTKWTDLCKAYLLEAKWYYSGYTPTLKEYLDNAWISITGHVMLAHTYLATHHITEEGLRNFQEYYPDIIYHANILVRLANDLGTSSYELKRGDVPKSIQCYMYESGASEEEAHEHIWKLIDAEWKKINEDQMAKSPFSRKFIEMAISHARVSLMIYQKDDGFGIEDNEIMDKVLSLFVHPIILPK
ncbi:hypothetical protein E1A91_D05G408200v1 [Gossypium mustelinum]|uniref:Terpene synthase N-terminal domain-containing protein n=1 Tax=Gossypium mustelinum TaxID=34275 RepID=A0A5D2V6N0_GOSMU|nr:hypothetical protein E1A91_D05G408200v1 [Gossypium mustelinum]